MEILREELLELRKDLQQTRRDCDSYFREIVTLKSKVKYLEKITGGYKFKDGNKVAVGSFFESFSTNNTVFQKEEMKKDDYQALNKKDRVAFESKLITMLGQIENKQTPPQS